MRFLAVLSALVLFAGCKHKPCDNGRYQIDTRPLPTDWAGVMATPDGAAMCFDYGYKPSRENETYVRDYDVPAKTGEDAHDKWTAVLTTKGWTKTPAARPKGDYGLDPDACHVLDRFDNGDFTLHLQIYTCDKGVKGWTHVVFERRDKK